MVTFTYNGKIQTTTKPNMFGKKKKKKLKHTIRNCLKSSTYR